MTRALTAVALAAVITASTAEAQEPRPTVSLVPGAAPRWDAAAHVTWLGEHVPERTNQWDRWFGAASTGGIVGYYLTSHIKAEFDVSTSTEGEIYSYEQIPLPGAAIPAFVQRDHEFRLTTASAGVAAQFFENAWFHPFVGAGLELVREREHIETAAPLFIPRLPTPGPAPPSETRVRYESRPYAATGFKVYVSERAFIRSDIRMSWSSEGLASLAWRNGVGVDF